MELCVSGSKARLRHDPGEVIEEEGEQSPPPDRYDPPSRDVEHMVMGRGPRIKNKRPDRHYVLVNKDDRAAYSEYLAMGYVVEEYSREEGALEVVGGVTSVVGEALELSGHVLMSVSKERHDEIVAIGAYGNSDDVSSLGGQRLADEIERRLIRNRGGAEGDPLRGLLGANHARLTNSTTVHRY